MRVAEAPWYGIPEVQPLTNSAPFSLTLLPTPCHVERAAVNRGRADCAPIRSPRQRTQADAHPKVTVDYYSASSFLWTIYGQFHLALYKSGTFSSSMPWPWSDTCSYLDLKLIGDLDITGGNNAKVGYYAGLIVELSNKLAKTGCNLVLGIFVLCCGSRDHPAMG